MPSKGTDLCDKGTIWVCRACGKTSFTQYGFNALNEGTAQRGWDESCMLNAVLCFLPGPPWKAVPPTPEVVAERAEQAAKAATSEL